MDTAIAVKSDSTALMSMIEKAISDPSFDVGKLQQLLTVKKEWEQNEARKAFVVALTAFKANPPKVAKTKKVEFGNTKYKHALLSEASALIGAALSQHGISHRWSVAQADGKIKVTCSLTHVLGHSESVSMECAADTSGSKNAIQSLGSAVSYLQRYTLFAISGVAATDSDDDGTASGPKPAPIPGPTDESEPTTITPDVVKKRGAEFVITDTVTKREYIATLESIAKHTKAINAKGGTMRLFFDVRDGKNIISSVE